MEQRVVIFDFDGTLADTAPIIRKIYSDLAIKNNWRVMTDKDYNMLRKGTLDEARRWSGIRFWQFPLVVRGARRLMKLESEKVRLFPGVIELIADLKADGVVLYVLSRNSPDTVRRVLERNKLSEQLEVLTLRKFPFGSKSAVIKQLIRDNQYDPKNIQMVGDEVRDVLASHKAGISCIAVSWGMQHTSILKRYKPTALVLSVDELRDTLR